MVKIVGMKKGNGKVVKPVKSGREREECPLLSLSIAFFRSQPTRCRVFQTLDPPSPRCLRRPDFRRPWQRSRRSFLTR
jgi:hypothetical protein